MKKYEKWRSRMQILAVVFDHGNIYAASRKEVMSITHNVKE